MQKTMEDSQIYALNSIDLTEPKSNYFQIDVLKAIMIFLVIFDHVVDWSLKKRIGVLFWERISIPVFLVLLGFNWGLSFRRKNQTKLKEMYGKDYFKNKLLRFLFPFLILYAISTIVGLLLYNFNFGAMIDSQYSEYESPIHMIIMYLPFYGPGNWFIPVLFQAILVIPLIYRLFLKNPKMAVILCFLVEFILHIFIIYTIAIDGTTIQEWHIEVFFRDSIFFYLSAIGMGMWLSFNHKIDADRNETFLFLLPVSLFYMIMYQFFRIGIPIVRGDYHYLTFLYAAVLFMFAMKYLPEKSDGIISKGIKSISKATYHILLVQIFYYAIIIYLFGTHYLIDIHSRPIDFLYLIIAWIICVPLGVLWYKLEYTIRRRKSEKKKGKLAKPLD